MLWVARGPVKSVRGGKRSMLRGGDDINKMRGVEWDREIECKKNG